MRAIVALENGVLELNYMWLPTVVGMNHVLKQEMEKELAQKFRGRALDEATLDEIHNAVVAFIEARFTALRGVGRYLDALKYIEVKS